MIILDTCVIISDALDPHRIGDSSKQLIEKCEQKGCLACCDISLWEITMLVNKGRLDPGVDAMAFLKLVIAARKMLVLPINPEIAHISVSHPNFVHNDPADRIIAATAMHYRASLMTFDARLQKIAGLETIG